MCRGGLVEEAPFFIVGSARSGTTLLRMMLNAHPQAAIPPESRFIVELYPGTDQIDVEHYLEVLGSHRQFCSWQLPIDLVAAELPESGTIPYAAAAVAPYRAFAKSHGKQRWGDKTPRYVLDIPLLARLWPEARFIHLVRDGRNVALSYADVPFGPKTVSKAARLWAKRVRAGVEAGAALGDRYIEIRYEDFVTDPEAQARLLCSFLGLEYDAQMLEYTTRSRGQVLPRASKYNPHVTEEPIAHTRSWETDMPDGQVGVFEAIAGDLLALFDYPVRHPKPSLATRTAAGLGSAGLPIGRLHGR
ncbi:MAG: hypothetical protein GEU71_04375 [Actinobacteria bacterium]|nr:hypothetical protein [Actinomycetota bacterium]